MVIRADVSRWDPSEEAIVSSLGSLAAVFSPQDVTKICSTQKAQCLFDQSVC